MMPRPIKDEGERRRVHGPVQPMDDRPAFRARIWRCVLAGLVAFWLSVAAIFFVIFS